MPLRLAALPRLLIVVSCAVALTATASPYPAVASPEAGTEEPAAGPVDAGARALLNRVGAVQDRLEVVATVTPLEGAASVWLEHGGTSELGTAGPRQVLSAGPEQQLTLSVAGLPRGPRHLRVVLQEDGKEPAHGDTVTTQVHGISIAMTSSTGTPDGAVIRAVVSGRDVDTDYWVEFGPTTSYGQEGGRLTVPAGSVPMGDRHEIELRLSGVAPGNYHFRLLAQSYPHNPPDAGQDLFFATNSTPAGPAWPACGPNRSTDCVRSFTIGGAVLAGFRPVVHLAGDVLQLGAESERHGQELLYPGSPVTEQSDVVLVVHAATFDPVFFGSSGRVQRASVEEVADGRVITFVGRPQRASYLRAGCTPGSCGDASTRADSDFTGRMTGGAFSARPQDSHYVEAARGMWTASNAQSSSAPSFDPATGALRVQLAAPHLTAAGALNSGVFRAFVPQRLVTEVWQVERPELLTTTVSNDLDDQRTQTVSTSWAPVEGGWLLTLDRFHYSSPVVTLAPPTTNAVPRVAVSPFVVKFGQTANVTITGTPGATVDLYIRKVGGSFIQIRDGLVLDRTGRTTVATKPDMNLRFMAKDRRVQQGSSIGGTDGLMTVEKNVSLNVQRVGTRQYTFTGSIHPMHPGAVVHLYRNGQLVRSGIPVQANRVYSFTGTFPAGTADFRVTSPVTGYNNLAHSPTRSVRVF